MYMGVAHILTYAKENEFVLSLNNDTAFDPDFIASLVDMSQAYGRAIVGSMEVDYHRRDRIVERGVWIDWNKYRFDVKTGPPENDTEICNEHVNVLPGKGTLIPIEVFKKIGNYNKSRFPHYIADYDFTVRAYNAGIKLVVSYKSKIYTRTDLTGCSITNRPLTIKEAYRNYFSIHSDTNIFDHIKFIQSYSPLKYRYAHIAMVFVRALYSLQIVRFLTKPARSAIQGMKDRNR
jgi:GT2 family glycosyltransferase